MRVGRRVGARARGAAVVLAAVLVGLSAASGCGGLGPAVVLGDLNSTSNQSDGTGTVGTVGAGAQKRCAPPAAGHDFEAVPPSAVGVDREAVRRTVDQQSSPATTSFRIYRRGCLIGQSHRDLTTATERTQLFSMTKSVVALAVGRAVALGALRLDDPIGRFLPTVDAAHGAITVRQLLTQTSGLRFAWANDLAGSMEDSVAQAMSLPFAHRPGTFFEYAQTTVTTLTAVVAAAVGREFQGFVSTELFEPVGIQQGTWRWAHDAVGNTQGYAWLELRPLDVARLATLVLDRGRWVDRQLIDANFIAEMDDGTAANPGYGFLVQTNVGTWSIGTFGGRRKDHRVVPSAPADTTVWSGFLEQGTFIVPSLDLVIVRLGLPPEAGWRDHIFRNLMVGIAEAPPFEGPLASPDGIDFDWNAIIDVGALIARNDAVNSAKAASAPGGSN